MTLLNGTMTPIETVTVGAGGAASITFSNIPQTYTDLVIVLSLRADSGTSFNDTRMTINSSTSGYTSRLLYGTGSGTGSASNNTTQYAYWVGSATTPSYTASTFSNIEVYIPNYSSSNNKSASVTGVAENNGTLGTQLMTALLWANSNAITSLSFTQDYGNYVQHSTATLYGVTSAGYGAKATGGIITSDADYIYHTFYSSGTFTPTQNLTCDYLVVAGGGGGSGGDYAMGGGGAGGLRCTVTATGGGGSLESALSLTSQAYTVTVGAGGSGGTGPADGSNGSNSVFSTITSTGGGGGGASGGGDSSGLSGGSGGGAGNGVTTSSGGAGTANQGYAGGSVINGLGVQKYPGAGGGGAGGVGQNTPNSSTGGNGGNGVTTIINGSSITYAGGGGGGIYAPYGTGGVAGIGGTGGGGNGGIGFETAATAGTANTGGGGGGDGGGTTGKNGGSGIVIIRYPK